MADIIATIEQQDLNIHSDSGLHTYIKTPGRITSGELSKHRKGLFIARR